MNRLIVGLATTVLLSGSVVGVLPATATALPDHPVPLRSWPGCPEDNPSGPCHWCPGDPPVQTGNLRTNPVVWDSDVCHTYWYVYFGQGNVAQNIFEGETPPPPPPPPPPGLDFCPIPPWCPQRLVLVVVAELTAALQIGLQAVDVVGGVGRRVEQRLLDDAVAGLVRDPAGDPPAVVPVSRLHDPVLGRAVPVDVHLEGIGRQRRLVGAPDEGFHRHLIVARVVVEMQAVLVRRRGICQADPLDDVERNVLARVERPRVDGLDHRPFDRRRHVGQGSGRRPQLDTGAGGGAGRGGLPDHDHRGD